MHEVLTWPVGRDADGQPRGRTAPLAPVLTYLIAAASSGAACASLIAGAGLALRGTIGVAEATLLLGFLPVAWLSWACQYAGRVEPLPERRAQVPTRWLQWGSRQRIAAAFGLVIGAGGLTYLKHATAWTLLLVLIVAPTVLAAAVVGAAYGVARGLPVLITWTIDRRGAARPLWERLGADRATLPLLLAPLGLATYLGTAGIYLL